MSFKGILLQLGFIGWEIKWLHLHLFRRPNEKLIESEGEEQVEAVLAGPQSPDWVLLRLLLGSNQKQQQNSSSVNTQGFLLLLLDHSDLWTINWTFFPRKLPLLFCATAVPLVDFSLFLVVDQLLDETGPFVFVCHWKQYQIFPADVNLTNKKNFKLLSLPVWTCTLNISAVDAEVKTAVRRPWGKPERRLGVKGPRRR